MIKLVPILILFYSIQFNAQTTDSVFVESDTLKTDSSGNFVSKDSLSTSDSTLITGKTELPDTIAPIEGKPLSAISNIIDGKTFRFNGYRYAGDFLRSFSFNFIKDFGFVGQPNETFLYGLGGGGTGFLEDGVLWNNRFTNSLDLNNIQSEDIDSIEIVPAPRGFLYTAQNYPVTVNFIMKDFVSPEPYTRLMYYQGPNGEAKIDGKFNAHILKKWNLSFQVTNRSMDSIYINSSQSLWQGNIKLKYFLSNAVNISALYNYVDSDVGLNGGVDIDSIAKTTNDINSVLYEASFAPVVYNNRKKSVFNHNFALRLLTLPFNEASAEATFYYKYYNDKIEGTKDSVRSKTESDGKIYGAYLRYDQKFGVADLQLTGNYETQKNNADFIQQPSPLFSTSPSALINEDNNYYSLSGLLSFNLPGNLLVPAVYYKYAGQNINQTITGDSSLSQTNNSERFSGVGADLSFLLNDEIKFYAGYSFYNSTNRFSTINSDTKTFEAGGKYKNNSLFADLKYFNRRGSNVTPYYNYFSTEKLFGNFSGVGLNLNYKFWKILVETNSSYYFNAEDGQLPGVPEIQFTGGLYLNGYFFEDNLWLKGGVVFTYTGKTNVLSETWRRIIKVDPSNKLDISVAGEIQNVAIVYFVWENLLGNQYFITPYYPMPDRNIRFGIAWELFN